MTIRQPASSQEYLVLGPISASDGSDVTTAGVSFAYLPEGDVPDENTDWLPASWVTGGPPYYAHQVVVGTGFGDGGEEAELDPGTYIVWIQLEDAPEDPRRPVERLIIYGNALSIT